MIWHIGMTEAPDMELLHELLKANTDASLPAYADTSEASTAEEEESDLIMTILSKLWEHKKYIVLGFLSCGVLVAAGGSLAYIYRRKKK